MASNDLAAADRLAGGIPESWRSVLAPAVDKPGFAALATWLESERERVPVYPSRNDVFHALALTPPEDVRAVILGQDPYFRPGEAHGLAFSVPETVKAPRSLRAIIRELQVDGGPHSLEPWARRGVLLLNTVLTVEHGRPGSHRRKGWEELTDTIIESVAASPRPVAFLLWGRDAQTKEWLIVGEHNIVHMAGHPASRPYPPRAADFHFAGRAGFAEVNEALSARGLPTIDWSLRPTGQPAR